MTNIFSYKFTPNRCSSRPFQSFLRFAKAVQDTFKTVCDSNRLVIDYFGLSQTWYWLLNFLEYSQKLFEIVENSMSLFYSCLKLSGTPEDPFNYDFGTDSGLLIGIPWNSLKYSVHMRICKTLRLVVFFWFQYSSLEKTVDPIASCHVSSHGSYIYIKYTELVAEMKRSYYRKPTVAL